jgi:hypothetical protein
VEEMKIAAQASRVAWGLSGRNLILQNVEMSSLVK